MNIPGQTKRKQGLFYSAYFLYLIATVLQSTMFTEYGVLAKILVSMRYAAFGIAAVKIFFDLREQWETENKLFLHKVRQRLSVRECLIYLFFMGLLFIGSVCTDDRSLIFVIILLIAAKEIDRDQIIKCTLYVQVTLMIFILLSSSVGIIPDLLFKRDTTPIRHAMGYTYPSVMVTHLFFVLLLYFWHRNTSINKKEFSMLAIIDFLIYKLTDSRTGFLIILFILLILFLVRKDGVVIRTYGILQEKTKSEAGKVLSHIYDYMPMYLTAILLLLSVSLPLKIVQTINHLLTNRVQLTWNAINEFGIHPFGSRIAWIGFGGVTDTDGLLESYNFVDSSYGFILVNYGWVILGLTLIAMIWCCKWVRRNESCIRKFIFLMVLLYCFIEPQLLEFQLNTFLILVVPLVTEVLPEMSMGKKTFHLKRKKS